MSLYDYRMSADIVRSDPPFYALIMAAIRKADSRNAYLLQLAFPEVCDEFDARYNAPGAILPSDPEGSHGGDR